MSFASDVKSKPGLLNMARALPWEIANPLAALCIHLNIEVY